MLKSNKYNNTLEDYINDGNRNSNNEDRRNVKATINNYY